MRSTLRSATTLFTRLATLTLFIFLTLILSQVLGYALQSSQILCLDLHPTKDNLALTGGADNKVVLLDRSSGKAVATMSGHTKKITRVLFHPTEDVAFSASSDKTVKIWNSSTGAATHTLKEHTADVTGITVHATGEFLVTASSDKSWAFYDIATGTCRAHVKDPEVKAGYRSLSPSSHPPSLAVGERRFVLLDFR